MALLAPAAPSIAVPAPPPPTACTPFSDTATHRTDERPSCLKTVVTLSGAPAVGHEARVDLVVDTTATTQPVKLEVTLPAGLEWVDPPGDLSSSVSASKVPVNRGEVHRAVGQGLAGKGHPWRLSGTIRAVDAGAAEIGVTATATSGDEATASTFVTVGAKTSSAGIAVKEVAQAAPAANGATRTFPRYAPKAVADSSAATVPAAKPAAAEACAAGSWNYVDYQGVARVSANARVKVYDADKGGDDLLASGLTDADGRYRLCFGNVDEDGTGQDVYVEFGTENPNWVIQNNVSKKAYRFTTNTRQDVANGETVDFGAFQPADPALMRGVEAFDTINTAWNWKPASKCWDARDTKCRQGKVNWAPDSTTCCWYDLQENAAYIDASTPDFHVMVLHEFGHGVMDDVYEDKFPDSPNCSPHWFEKASSAGCAWTEGWASWFAMTVLDDPHYYWPGGYVLDLESPTWGTTPPNWENGDTVEGRVLGAMIDLGDGGDRNEAGDTCSEDPTKALWNTFLDDVSGSFAAFWAARAKFGYSVGPNELSCLYHNTIDYR
ncbi:hypothetical protein JOF29_007179 [Kribbella aluminosa]|uniref:Uncharacterized protein n=1 Tax=Kribbella aluminosa TaxID=416017 RepID=A0ABS4UWP5_9ACTN|nr:hypothetical protein [Kribbella aluminosa]MBP2356069.1 hypothetical protein [Kribbella aluminosa]